MSQNLVLNEERTTVLKVFVNCKEQGGVMVEEREREEGGEKMEEGGVEGVEEGSVESEGTGDPTCGGDLKGMSESAASSSFKLQTSSGVSASSASG